MTPLGEALQDRKFRKLYVRMATEGRIRSPNASGRRIADVHYGINARTYYRDVLDTYAVDGKIGVHRSGMDCDCTQYSRSYITEAHTGAFAFCMEEMKHEQYLDGPESTRFSLPEHTIVESKSLDLALRAYEDGHPSTVYIVDESELIPR